jgi:glucose/arabinose dehydrogenase
MSRDYIRVCFAAVSIVFAVAVTAVCQTPQPSPQAVTPPLPNVVQTDRPQVFSYDPTKLPAPYHTESARRNSRVIPQPANATLTVPKGFKVNVYAEGGFTYPRWMALAPNGDVFLADSRANSIVVLRDKNKDGVADERFVWSDKLAQPFGMAFHKDWFYVANTDSVVRFSYKSGQTQASGEPEKLVELTAGGYNQHWTRNVIFSPDGKKMFVSIGSASNVSVEEDPRRAAISVYDPDGKNHKIYAGGLRNPIGLAWNPKTGELWTAVNERDGLGDDLVPDYATSVKEGGWYGWPYSYLGKNRDPRRKEETDLIDKTIVPDVIFQSHVAALGITFYQGKMFPKEYQNDAFVAFHGSWNRAKLSGYTVVRISFDDKGNLEANRYENFVSGWLPDENSNEVWGRPVGLLVLHDGSLLIADDGGRKIWRVSYGTSR